MFGHLYRMKYNEHAYTKDYEHSESPYYHYRIPAQTFEDTVFSYFSISLTDFRKRASYNEEEDFYPWQDIDATNIYYFPSLTPEVTAANENSDGSVTLCVTVMCLDMRTDCLFKHEVTIMPQDNGKFKYLSNQVTYRSDKELPSSSPRIPAQRTAD